MLGKLSARKVATLKTPGKYGDGAGLWLYVREGGRRYWVFRFMRQGRAREMGLGSADLLTLKQARQRAHKARQMLAEGLDPIEERRKMQAVSSMASFAECAEDFISSNEAAWSNPKHRAQWRATLAAYAFPMMGDKPVDAIGVDDVLRALTPIWSSKPETASRVRGRIERVLDFARARGLRSGENPARWRGHLDKLLPKHSRVRTVQHLPALPWRKVPEFMEQLRRRGGIAARALEFLVLTAARSGEVRLMRWAEVDLSIGVWTVPASRMKAKREHRVPLSKRALRILSEVPRIAGSDLVFPGQRPGNPLSDMTLAAVLRRMNYGEYTAHGFRSTFRDWCAENTAFPGEVAEMALAHTIRNKVESAYRRGDLFEKRRRLMEAWADYCEQAGGKVLEIPA